ncbi:hypothetical protein NP493_764g00020 [Ridgeia piscesae]|uniref:Uncharacterized protein n=1 Tax=Ridgeia piscesae TaxID=27915 RepID=A0AAD9NNL2_RIDPI|nr:hypothetical protein NP493_764g00020 [Ridgeia piscesae]
MSGGFWGGCRFSSSSKCSIHLFNWSLSPYIAIRIIHGPVCMCACNFLLVFLLYHTVVSCVLGLMHPLLLWLIFNEVFLVCLYAVHDCSVCLCILFLRCCFWCSRSAVVNCTFCFLPQCHFVVVYRKPVLLLVFLLSQNFAACADPHLLDLLPLCVYAHISFFKKIL